MDRPALRPFCCGCCCCCLEEASFPRSLAAAVAGTVVPPLLSSSDLGPVDAITPAPTSPPGVPGAATVDPSKLAPLPSPGAESVSRNPSPSRPVLLAFAVANDDSVAVEAVPPTPPPPRGLPNPPSGPPPPGESPAAGTSAGTAAMIEDKCASDKTVRATVNAFHLATPNCRIFLAAKSLY
jgi:hypothetical protein